MLFEGNRYGEFIKSPRTCRCRVMDGIPISAQCPTMDNLPPVDKTIIHITGKTFQTAKS
jgi:hypothetical protein